MIKDVNLILPPFEAKDSLFVLKRTASVLGVNKSRIQAVKYIRESIDARRKDVKINLLVRAFIDEDETPLWNKTLFPVLDGSAPVCIVVGSGPAGLFAALTLLENGIRPVVLERGKDVHERKKDCALLSREGRLDENSNYSFGEGGAGAFSDGKLYTRSDKRGDVKKVLSLFVQHGAEEDILYLSHPHIGSDRLPVVIENMRKTIISHGGEVHFNTRVTSLLFSSSTVVGVGTENGEEYLGPVILATGHSAKDVYRFLDKSGIKLEEKDTAVGVRIESPQHLIDQIQYHSEKGRGEYLPPASYSFVTRIDGRGVYSFCMCPGGSVVPAATENGMQVVNGMSASGRLGRFANAAFVVELRKSDVPGSGIWGMLDYIESIERKSFLPLFKAPSERLVDFINGKVSSTLPPSSYAPGVVPADLYSILPPVVSSSLKKGMMEFNRRTGDRFITSDTLMLASETRTSSPVRISRDGRGLSSPGLYAAGEGAGYAGGIVSAALDGIMIAGKASEDIWKKN